MVLLTKGDIEMNELRLSGIHATVERIEKLTINIYSTLDSIRVAVWIIAIASVVALFV